MELVRLLKRQVRRSPMLVAWLQPPATRVTVALRRSRLRFGYGLKVLDQAAMNAWIAQRIARAEPTTVGKIGTLELELLVHDRTHSTRSQRAVVPRELRRLAHDIAGFFPDEDAAWWAAIDAVRAALPGVDALGVFGSAGERAVVRAHARKVSAVCATGALEPWGSAQPWTSALAGKRVLVVHPFVDSIVLQYQKRRELWARQPELLPDFELQTLQMPLSPALVPPTDKTWLERLARMRDEMSTRRFDVALIGAGGMSLPLAVHAKALGAIGVHMGGSTQILFGVLGRRWEEQSELRPYFNDSWSRPSSDETPAASTNIEGGCYW